MTDLDKLEALAKAALKAKGDNARWEALDALESAANPATILDLIASARRDAEEIERLRAGLEEVVCWFGEAPNTFPDWRVTAEALADMAQNVLEGHPALSSPASRAAHTGEG